MKSLAAIVGFVGALFVTVGAAEAGEIVIAPKPSDSAVVLAISGGKVVKANAVGTANAGEIVIKPKASDSAVILTISGGKIVKASVMAKPEHMAKPEPVKDTAVFARTP
jgi:archaeosine-15-forming tRNA-guanine transglycosylase